MACAAITTGQGFLVETLSHLDCQAQVIGSYGYTALADPGSPTMIRGADDTAALYVLMPMRV